MKNHLVMGLLCATAALAATPEVDAQIPIDTNHLTLVRLRDGETDVIRVLITNDLRIGAWQPGTEYWYAARDLGAVDLRSLSMSAARLTARTGEAQIAELVGGFELSFSVRQEVGEGAWSAEPFKPASERAALFEAGDPDAPERRIGLMLEQDEDTGRLTAATWFKSFNTGLIFDETPERLSFAPVLDPSGAPSLDPADIDAVDWFFFSAGRTR